MRYKGILHKYLPVHSGNVYPFT